MGETSHEVKKGGIAKMKFKPMWLLNYVLADPGNLEKLDRREKVLAFDQLMRVMNPITKAALKVLKNATAQDFALVEDRAALANLIERSRPKSDSKSARKN